MRNKDKVVIPVEKRGFDMLHERWDPKWKCFNPPMWWIFRWAFSIRKTLYTNCYPIATSTGGISIASNPIAPTDSIEIEFNTTPFKSEAIEKKANDFMTNLKTVMEDSRFPMLICNDCIIGKYGPYVYVVSKEGCIHSDICARAYHLGFVDGVCDEGMRTDMYRGDHAYREREDSK